MYSTNYTYRVCRKTTPVCLCVCVGTGMCYWYQGVLRTQRRVKPASVRILIEAASASLTVSLTDCIRFWALWTSISVAWMLEGESERAVKHCGHWGSKGVETGLKMYRVPSESIQTLDFFHILLGYSLILISIKLFLSSTHNTP